MKPATPAATHLSSQLNALTQKGITDRGNFAWEKRPAGEGFAQVTFEAPHLFAKPSFLKGWSNASEYQSQLQLYRTEKALNLRDALFAALAQEPVHVGTLEKLATALVRQGQKGVDLDKLNWGMGKEARERNPHDFRIAERQEKLVAAVHGNLVKLARQQPSGGVKAMPDAVRDVLERLKFGVAMSALPPTRTAARAEGAQRPEEAGRLALLEKEEATLRQVITDGNDRKPWVGRHDYRAAKERLNDIQADKQPLVAVATRFAARDALAATVQTTTNTTTTTITTTTTLPTPLHPSAMVTQTAPSEVERLETHIQTLQQQLATAVRTIHAYQLGESQVSAEQYDAAESDFQRLKPEMERYEALKAGATTSIDPSTPRNT